ncbi:MAG: hypothetical protein R3C19_18650 [Planctomycetaceae bacterium]
MQRLQVKDAVRHLRDVDASQVVRIGLPKWAWWTPASVALAVLVALLPSHEKLIEAAAAPLDESAAIADRVDDELDDLQQAAQESGLEEFERLVNELRKQTAALKDPEADLPTALATLSDMQQKLQQLQTELSIAATDTQLKSLGEALETAEPFQPAAEALKQGDLAGAADKLKAADPESLDAREARAAAEKLAEVSKAMQDAGMNELSEKTSSLERRRARSAGRCRSEVVRRRCRADSPACGPQANV